MNDRDDLDALGARLRREPAPEADFTAAVMARVATLPHPAPRTERPRRRTFGRDLLTLLALVPAGLLLAAGLAPDLLTELSPGVSPELAVPPGLLPDAVPAALADAVTRAAGLLPVALLALGLAALPVLLEES